MAKVSSFKGKKKGQNRSKKVVAANKLKKKAMKNKGVTKVKGKFDHVSSKLTRKFGVVKS